MASAAIGRCRAASRMEIELTVVTRTDVALKVLPGEHLKTRHVWLMALSAGVIVANIYYIQPLLSSIAADFRISVSTVGAVAMLSQLGTAVGMLVFVPLGDTKERRIFVVRLLLAATVCLLLMATSQHFWCLAVASLGIGLTGAIPHVIIPYAANLSSPERRGATVGSVLSGLLLGILLARTVSGLVGAWLGWRSIYWIAAILMLLVALLVHNGLPRSEPELNLSWSVLLRSAVMLIRTQPLLRESALSELSSSLSSAHSGLPWSFSCRDRPTITEVE
jgi:predicted MFS family arabinose efflux permease